ncbi:MAG: hypothetical protein ABF384_18215 [Verrucomicrobiales bacterium]
MRAVIARLTRSIRPHMTRSSGISPDLLALRPTVSWIDQFAQASRVLICNLLTRCLDRYSPTTTLGNSG